MYPGQIITTEIYSNLTTTGFNSGSPYNIVQFGLDNNGTFYKAAGMPCMLYYAVNFPYYGNNIQGGYMYNSNLGYFEFRNGNSANAYFESAFIFSTGLGKIASCYTNFPEYLTMSKTCAFKNGSVYYGNPNFVGLSENTFPDSGNFKLYPNPATTKFYVEFYTQQKTPATISIYNTFGQLVFEENFAAASGQNLRSLPIDTFAKGVYMFILKPNWAQ